VGLDFPEGPVVLPNGQIAFVEMRRQCVTINDGGRRRTLATVKGSPNGMALGPDNALYLANNGGITLGATVDDLWTASEACDGCVQRLELGGAVSGPLCALPGRAPIRPNDLCFGPDGRLFVTDPHNWEVLPDLASYRPGCLYVWQPGSKAAELVAEIDGFPNGVALDPTGRRLYVAQTLGCRILVLPLMANGSIGQPELFADLTGYAEPDGLCCSPDGTLFVAGSITDQVVAVSDEGAVLDCCATGAGSCPTNLCLDGNDLWVTLGLAGTLVRIPIALP
jgi:gluconolactonase